MVEKTKPAIPLWLKSAGVACLMALAVIFCRCDVSFAQALPTTKPMIVSLDEGADQYVLGLVPRSQIMAVSDHARLTDSYFRDRAVGVRVIKPQLETLLALHPDIVVRTWGGDIKLLQRLEANHIKIININSISSFDQARSELMRVGHLLGQDTRAEIEAHRFDQAMADIRPVGAGRSVLYYTPSGFSAGPDTLVGDMLLKLGFRLETQNKGFYYLSPEVLLSMKPDVFALAFYDDRYAMRRVPGRNPLVHDLISRSVHFSLPASSVSFSGWYTAYGLQQLSQQAIK